ncbi:hypothetical protein [Sodalis sp.]
MQGGAACSTTPETTLGMQHAWHQRGQAKRIRRRAALTPGADLQQP